MTIKCAETSPAGRRRGSRASLARPLFAMFVVLLCAGCASSSSSSRESGGAGEAARQSNAEEEEREIVDVAVGGRHACAADGDGRVYCWGDNRFGQLGVPAAETADRAVQVRGLPPIESVVAGAAHTCALSRDGRVACWGQAGKGEVGDPNLEDSDDPGRAARQPTWVRGPGGQVVWVQNHRDPMGLYCPRDVEGKGTTHLLDGIVDVAAGDDETCAVHESGAVLCWGADRDDHLGVKESGRQPTATSCASPLEGIDDAVDVEVGSEIQCVRTKSESTVCWGNVGSGGGFANLGGEVAGVAFRNLVFQGVDELQMAALSAFEGSSALAVGRSGVCGIDGDGGLTCETLPDDETGRDDAWGAHGEVSDAAAVVVGGPASCVLREGGEASCSGIEGPDAGEGDDDPLSFADLDVGGFVEFDGAAHAPVSTGGAVCGVASGEVRCWGDESQPIVAAASDGSQEDPSKVALPSPVERRTSDDGRSTDGEQNSCKTDHAFGDPDAPNELRLQYRGRSRTFHLDDSYVGEQAQGWAAWSVRFPTIEIGDEQAVRRPKIDFPFGSSEAKLQAGESYSAIFRGRRVGTRCLDMPPRAFGTVTIEKTPSGSDGEQLVGTFDISSGTAAMGAVTGRFSIGASRISRHEESLGEGNRWEEHQMDSLRVSYNPASRNLSVSYSASYSTEDRFGGKAGTDGFSDFPGEPGTYVRRPFGNLEVWHVDAFSRSRAKLRYWVVSEEETEQNGEDENPAANRSLFESPDGAEEEGKTDVSIPPENGRRVLTIDTSRVSFGPPAPPVSFDPLNVGADGGTDDGPETIEPTFQTGDVSPVELVYWKIENPVLEGRLKRHRAEPSETQRVILGTDDQDGTVTVTKRVTGWGDLGGCGVGTVHLNPDTLFPKRRVYRGRCHSTRVEVEYTDQAAVVTASNDTQGEQQRTFEADGPVLDARQIPWTLGYLPLESGYATTFHVFRLDGNRVSDTSSDGSNYSYYEIEGVMERATFRVLGTRQLDMGPVDTEVYRAELEIERWDGDRERTIHWFRKEAPHVPVGRRNPDYNWTWLLHLSRSPRTD